METNIEIKEEQNSPFPQKKRKFCSQSRAKYVCTTSNLYVRALRYFSEALSKLIAESEEKVFVARAHFELTRQQDREHYEFTRKRKLRVKSDDAFMKNFVGGFMYNETDGETGKEEEKDEEDGQKFEADRIFIEDQKKLYLEHEELLQQTYPFAFLDEKSSALMALELIPRLRRNLEALAIERTRRYKEKQRESADNPNLSLSAAVAASSAKKSSSGVVGSFNSMDIGRGAYIIPLPQARRKPLCKQSKANDDNSCNDSVVNSLSCEEEKRNSGRVVSHKNANVSTTSADFPPEVMEVAPWLTNIKSQGAVEFARAAFCCNEQHQQKRYEEKRQFLEACLAHATSEEERCKAQEVIRRLEQSAEAEALKKAKLWRAWQAVAEKINETKHFDDDGDQNNIKQTQKSRKEKRTSPRRKFYKQETNSERRNWDNSSEYSLEQSQKDTMSMTFYNEEDMSDNSNSFQSTPAFTSTFSSSSLLFPPTAVGDNVPQARPKCPFFNLSRWEIIYLDNQTANDKNVNKSEDMEALVDLYIWPHHVEKSIPHVLCGETLNSGKGCFLFKHFVFKLTDEEGTGGSRDNNNNNFKDSFSTRKKVPYGKALVFAFPRYASKVWLKIDSLGEFVASTMRVIAGT